MVPGNAEPLRHHGVALDVRQDEICIQLMTDFIEQNPELWNEDIGEEEVGK